MSIEMSLLIAVIGAAIGIMGAITALKKDSKSQGVIEASISSKVDYIAHGVDDIKLEIRDQARKIEAHNERLARVEESAKSAHKRIDKMEETADEN